MQTLALDGSLACVLTINRWSNQILLFWVTKLAAHEPKLSCLCTNLSSTHPLPSPNPYLHILLVFNQSIDLIADNEFLFIKRKKNWVSAYSS